MFENGRKKMYMYNDGTSECVLQYITLLRIYRQAQIYIHKLMHTHTYSFIPTYIPPSHNKTVHTYTHTYTHKVYSIFRNERKRIAYLCFFLCGLLSIPALKSPTFPQKTTKKLCFIISSFILSYYYDYYSFIFCISLLSHKTF